MLTQDQLNKIIARKLKDVPTDRVIVLAIRGNDGSNDLGVFDDRAYSDSCAIQNRIVRQAVEPVFPSGNFQAALRLTPLPANPVASGGQKAQSLRLHWQPGLKPRGCLGRLWNKSTTRSVQSYTISVLRLLRLSGREPLTGWCCPAVLNGGGDFLRP